MRIGKITAVFMVTIIALTSCGISYAHWTDTREVGGTVQTGKFQHGFTACSSNDPPGTTDPGKDKDVACCSCELAVPESGSSDFEQVIVTIQNAYPCYECAVSVTVHNDGTVPSRIASLGITSPPEVSVTHIDNLLDVVLDPDESVDGTFVVHVKQEARQGYTYTFTITIGGTALWHTGTIGFWKNGDKHKTYSQNEIESWLSAIDSDSAWLGQTTVGGMGDIFKSASGGTMEQKFLGHYLAQRLNLESGRQGWDTTHNVATYDPNNYLGLTSPATTSEIVSAIEGKYGSGPTEDQFEIMKDVCDALNNLSI